ncbi:MAG: dTDP-glucose 4,6-dehydratase [Desulfuromonadaceae bacterium]|nr:dTDP-glucose 4,6-dehydratase [Desulfuromonas sp.]MDY0185595.1 dTDP-glucose 4,6-dehydratase [Desulfuromonadaceae bacterium]
MSNVKSRKNVLVTGGCGFIGSNFIRHVLDSYPHWHIVNMDKLTYAGNPANLADVAASDAYTFVRADICDAVAVDALFTRYQIDTVVHFAAESHVDRSISGPAEFIRTNINGTFALLEAARKHWGADDLRGKRFLHVSTDEVYGSLGETGQFTEQTPYDPHSPYSASKAASDHLVNAYFHTYGLPTLITNCSNNYGPYQFPEKLIPLAINHALTGIEIPVYGDGKNVRDWLYVEDHCRAITTVLENGSVGETYNIGGNSEKQNIEVVTTICNMVDAMAAPLTSGQKRTSLIRYVADRAGHDWRYAIDATKIATALGWSPRMDFAQGIEKTVTWCLENSAWVESILDGSYQDEISREKC